jgi:hypothetical protein
MAKIETKKYDPTTNPFDRRFKGDITKMGLSSFAIKKMREKNYVENDKLQADTSAAPEPTPKRQSYAYVEQPGGNR